MKALQLFYKHSNWKQLTAILLIFLPYSILPNNVPSRTDDSPPPVITCPTNIITNNDPGLCSAVVDYIAPSGAVQTTGLASGSAFPVGTTINTFVLGADVCSFTVTVNDNELPVITCPDDIIMSANASLCQVVYYDLPTATDNCGNTIITHISGPASGSVFPIGETTVTYRATDIHNNFSDCSFTINITGNNCEVLAYDGTTSQQMVPQGGLRYQRSFYLIRADEITGSDLVTGININSIGFTMGIPQNEITEGSLKIYLQNTTDMESRYDDDWTVLSSVTSPFTLSGLTGGNYEWQVKPPCSDPNDWSDSLSFSTENPYECDRPYNPETTDLTSSSATVTWETLQASTYQLEYSISPFDVWTSLQVTETEFNLSGLESGKNYQWKVKAICGSENSPYIASSFTTELPDYCSEPTGLLATVNTSSVTLSWTALPATDVSYYSISYRRKGSNDWITLISMSNTIELTELTEGTTYEWRIRANCKNSSDMDCIGSYIAGSNFTTNGDTACWSIEGSKTSNISLTSAILSWLNVPNATTYDIRFRQKESISWTNAIAGMTLVSDGSVKIPNTIGKFDIPFEGGTDFTYTGGGIYIAMEYSNASSALSSFNSALTTKQNTWVSTDDGISTEHQLLGFNGNTYPESTSLPTVLISNDNRPETRFGSSDLNDVVEAMTIYAIGKVALPYGSSAPVSVLVKNYSAVDLTVPISLKIYDQESTLLHSETINQLLTSSCGTIVGFLNWLPDEYGSYLIEVSLPDLPDEDITENNHLAIIQQIGNVYESYADGTPAIDGAGAGSSGGMILSRFGMAGCGMINAAEIFLHYSAKGHSISAVILDNNGNIIDISSPIIPDESIVNEYYTFYFPNTPVFTNQDYYIGLSQSASGSEYFPVGVQWEGNIIRDNAYYRGDLDGGIPTNTPIPGRLMINAQILPAMDIPVINGSNILCNNGSNTLLAESKSIRYANSVVSFSSEYSGSNTGAREALGPPDVYPQYNGGSNTWMNKELATDYETRDYITLAFPDAAPINYLDIYETFNPGAVETVYLKNSEGEFVTVYSDTASNPSEVARIKHIAFPVTDYNVSEVKISLHTGKYKKYHAIDAVALGQTSSPATFSSYSWSPGGSTGNSISVSSPGTYSLTVTNASGCSMTEKIEVVTPIIATPFVTADGPLEFCEGGSVILTSSQPENIIWSSGETSNSISVGSSGSYTVTYNNGCETATSAPIVVIVNPTPSATITGGPICQGGFSTLSAEGGYTSYSWSTLETTPSISVTLPGVYYLMVTDGHGCTGTSSINAFAAPMPYPVITGDPYFCPGESTILSAGGEFTSYYWSTDETSNSIEVSTSELIELTVTNEYGCSGSDQVNTGTYPSPQPFIAGSLSLCSGSTTILKAGEGYSSYLWSTDETSSSITVNTSGTFSVTVTDVNSCVGTTSATIDMEGSLPEVPGEITGPLQGLCQAIGIEYSIEPVTNTEYYVWIVPEGMTISEGQGTTDITVDASEGATGTISVAANNKCGQSPTWNGRYISVDGAPGVPTEINGLHSGVCGLTEVYTLNDVYGAASYNWVVPQGATIIGMEHGQSITLSFTSDFVSGTLCATAVNDCGVSEPVCLNISGAPEMPSEISGPTILCNKQKNVSYSVMPVDNTESYYWTVPMQANIVSGQGSNVIIVNFGTKSGNITVKAINYCGNSLIQTLPVQVSNCKGDNITPITLYPGINPYELYGPDWNYTWGQQVFNPEVISNAGDFSLAGSLSMSWTLGEPVIQTIGKDYMITQGFHQEYYTQTVVYDNILDNYTITVYPVPAKEFVNLRIISEIEAVDLLIELYDMMGNIVFSDRAGFRIYERRIWLNQYATGMLIIKVTDISSNRYKSFKIIRMK